MARWLKEGNLNEPFRFNLSFKPVDHVLVAEWMQRLPHGHVTQALLQAASFALEAGFVYVDEVPVKRSPGRPRKKPVLEGAVPSRQKMKVRAVIAPDATEVVLEVSPRAVSASPVPSAVPQPRPAPIILAPTVSPPVVPPATPATVVFSTPNSLASNEHPTSIAVPTELSQDDLDVMKLMASQFS